MCARIKEELLKEFNLHTIVRLPNGVFAPYTSIPTNILFFDRSGPTREVWYYEQPLPDARKTYTKTQPLRFEEFADCMQWWDKREESDRAWKWNFRQVYEEAIARATPHWQEAEKERNRAAKLNQQAKNLAAEIDQLCNNNPMSVHTQRAEKLTSERENLLAESSRADQRAKEEQAAGDAVYWPIYNLDRKNPRVKERMTQLPPNELAADILEKEQRIAEIMANIQKLLAQS